MTSSSPNLATINDLSVDVFEDILSLLLPPLNGAEFHGSWVDLHRTLSSCSQVCKSWTDPANSLLYSHIDIHSTERLRKLSTSVASLRRYQRRGLCFHSAYNFRIPGADAAVDAAAVETILLNSPRVKEVYWGTQCATLPARVFGLLSLTELEMLTLYGPLDNSQPLESVPFRLQNFRGNLLPNHGPLIKEIVDASLIEGKSTLRFIDFRKITDDHTILSTMFPVASSLTELRFTNPDWNFDGPKNYAKLANTYLPLTSSTTKFLLGISLTKKPETAHQMAEILRAIRYSLETLTIWVFFVDKIVHPAFWEVLADGLSSWRGLENLSAMIFVGRDLTLERLETCEGWDGFREALRVKDVKLTVQAKEM